MVRAQIGDVMKVNVRHPHPQTLVLTLMTQAAADYATELLNDPNSGWRLERAEKKTSPSRCEQCDGKRYVQMSDQCELPCSACNAMGETPRLNRGESL